MRVIESLEQCHLESVKSTNQTPCTPYTIANKLLFASLSASGLLDFKNKSQLSLPHFSLKEIMKKIIGFSFLYGMANYLSRETPSVNGLMLAGRGSPSGLNNEGASFPLDNHTLFSRVNENMCDLSISIFEWHKESEKIGEERHPYRYYRTECRKLFSVCLGKPSFTPAKSGLCGKR